ncbi:hypothetical protein CDV50_03265 [Haematobacter massiliensis]|nr:hypothetical protein CDV50_03265 [Haematobacter massiliensis]
MVAAWNTRAIPAAQEQVPQAVAEGYPPVPVCPICDIAGCYHIRATQEALHRSFPEAGDGRPLPPMGDDLMSAGLSAEDARFVAVQLVQNGLMLVSADAIEAQAARIKVLEDALRRLGTAECFGNGETLGLSLSEDMFGREILTRMAFARDALSPAQGGSNG